MSKTVIFGTGYVGRDLIRIFVARGDEVRATTTSPDKLPSIAALGAEPVLARATDSLDALRSVMQNAETVFHLAPPEGQSAEDVARAVCQATGPNLQSYIYASTTAVFGPPLSTAHNPEVDEHTPPNIARLTARGWARLNYERALRATGLPLKVVRIAGIYGPGRTLRQAIEQNRLMLIAGQPKTSRVHVEDLTRLLAAMAHPDAPPLVVACDELPAHTSDVARYTCALLGHTPPEPITQKDAQQILSPLALEMRLGGHCCRSLFRASLIGPLLYPTYREGVRQSLEVEGALEGGHRSC